MPKMSYTTKLGLVLDKLNVESLLKRQIMYEMMEYTNKPDKQVRSENALDWKALIRSVRSVRGSHVSNKYRWSASQQPLFAEYETLLNKTIARMEKAQLTGLSVEAYSVRVRTTGDTTKGVCDKHWFNWIPDGVKADFKRRLDIYYTNIGRLKGSRLRPFTTPEIIQERTNRIARLRKTIANIRRTASTPGCENGDRSTSDTLRGALYLCAARRAEIELWKREKTDEVIPVNWMALVGADMRARLRDADEYPEAITKDGLQDFVVHPNHNAEDQAAIEAGIDAAPWAASNHETPDDGDEE